MSSKSKKFSQLIEPALARKLKGQPDPVIQRIVIDSRRVTPGSLFFALPGLKNDGNAFVDEAISRGAVAVVSRQPRRFRSAKLAYIVCEDPRKELAHASRLFFDQPDEALSLVGITGTNGKTTVSFLAKQLLADRKQAYGCIGTVGYDLVKRTVPSFRTTPESHELCELLSQMRAFECQGTVMEVSSHGIDQQRVAGLQFEVAVFLNLTRDHLDYHGDMESYFQVKRRLFVGEIGPKPKVAIINVDDAFGRRLAQELDSEMKVITFGVEQPADLKAASVALDAGGTQFTLSFEEREIKVNSSLIGHYNVSNALAALAICHALGQDLEACVGSLANFSGIPGRMQKVETSKPFTVLVDYAHTEDALHNALKMLRQVTTGKLRVVFGCGGNRDRGKRPNMTRVANEQADEAWATSDNPRNERIESIFEDMKEGVVDERRIRFVPDRRRAIELALKSCGPGDCLLIAGKGHESFQEYGETVVPFDDRKVAAELLENMRLGGQG
ncbi:UDP-N-acetylmuramoyl-L-alanyl-D-glutamate--2,6-diaminopimelate ligase [Pelagicoccus sp. SDUM812003]|uniref:UDP-N-acetylmuramoyl-L-alanyl-D-glutamate--2, 6-diaminopimelate ligase n=1 Tax=Pelagicoccus sp. SDUM812003 TaxID=3041267 RepID=UPI00280D0C4E|nr:UDP-N-acetylmuramoyl-L-alanyl-D-glutamate--2,6-diaminopimelate ligase [Pelagicoccus sp. SDUM812003]MDQ8204407.1 UDP-N-acetylmuramoyl-L-alanyl-D-glutamate--2,6-diaminopimelate ligase [Pelagicoccus sp. SDUM812003]